MHVMIIKKTKKGSIRVKSTLINIIKIKIESQCPFFFYNKWMNQ